MFASAPFTAGEDSRANPYLGAIVRLPLDATERPVPVGAVSPSYALVQHRGLGELCIESLQALDLYYERLRCDLEISELGEWAHLRFRLGDTYTLVPPDGHALDLCIDVYNSVDGSSRLILEVSWLRLICTNGLVVRNSELGLKAAHDRRLDLDMIGHAIHRGLRAADEDLKTLRLWWESQLRLDELMRWADGPLALRWGRVAAARCLHICRTGHDARPVPFEGGEPSKRAMIAGELVPGAAFPADTVYDLAQALSWIASTQPDVTERRAWQSDIPELLDKLDGWPRGVPVMSDESGS
ncbi:DUF932 domain-containing protein [Sphingomonas sp. DBB INV C78]|uniref:DUF932 domain-containing protein n=1 Tax=Sphingomonas sp. DBB INV C78 TaxID=3349434 RepID=UPI0036D30D83